MVACPNCGKDVREDFAFCPFCEYPLKPFCPSCRREISADYVRCPYCGFKLKGSSAAQIYKRTGGYPMGMIIVSVGLLVTGLFGVGQGVNSAYFDVLNYATPTFFPAGAQTYLIILVILGSFIALMGAVQIMATYGLLTRKRWSKRAALLSVGLATLLYFVFLTVDTLLQAEFSTAPLLQLVPPDDTVFVFWSLAMLVVLRVYLGRQYVKELLGFTYIPTFPN